MARKRTKWLEVNDDQVAGIVQVIQQLPGKGYSLKMLIADMRSEIQQAIDRGYSYPEMAAILTQQGIKIAPRTLRAYLKTGKGKPKTQHSPDIIPATPKPSTAPPKSSKSASRKSQTIGEFVEMPDEL
jgi:ABC-type sugar transport system substrate-binding protein